MNAVNKIEEDIMSALYVVLIWAAFIVLLSAGAHVAASIPSPITKVMERKSVFLYALAYFTAIAVFIVLLLGAVGLTHFVVGN